MTRKDTILVAIVINAGLLAILFIMAVIYDTDKGSENSEFVAPLLVDNKALPVPPSSQNLIAVNSTGDEVDNVLKYYHPTAQPFSGTAESGVENERSEILTLQGNSAPEEELSLDFELPLNEEIIEVKVKKGDVLEKIAKAHKVSVSVIKRMNHLENERLFIGQILKIPAKSSSNKLAESKKEEGAEAIYYVVKSGDNPWKIAKQYNVKFEDILLLNRLDEDKARNLKIGDRIRVK